MQEYRENDILREISKKSRKVRKRKPHRMKIAWKRVLSVVVVIAIVLCLMPLTGTQSVQAADYRSIYFGTSGVLGYHDGTYDKIYLGGGATPHEWRILDTAANGSTGVSGRALFVESTTSYAKVSYSDTSDTYQWSGSIPRQQAQSAYHAYFSETDKEIVLPTTKGISEAEKAYSTSSALNGDYLYLLSREEYSNSTYGFDVVSGDTWTNRDKAAWTRTGWKSNKAGVGNAYILGSKGDFTASAIAGSTGPQENLYFGMNMNGDVSAVLFTTDSSVKSQGLDGTKLKETTSSRNSNWKITQLKSDITLKTTGLSYVSADKKVQADSYSITNPDGLTGTPTLSAMMTEGAYGESDAQILYYSKISTSNGSFDFTLPTEYSANANYHIYLIPEVQNSGYTVDYAGMPVEVDITDNTEYTISAAANPAVGGTVTESVTVKAGENATLTATPAVGYKFLGWSKQGVTDPVYVSTTPSFTVTNVTASANYVADFEQSSYLISVNASPEAGGFVSGGGTVAAGGSTTLKAVAEDGYSFSRWMKNGVQVSTNASYTVDNVTEDASYTAVFNKTKVYLTFAMFPVGVGNVLIGSYNYNDSTKTFGTMGASSTETALLDYNANSTQVISAAVRKDSGYTFAYIHHSDGATNNIDKPDYTGKFGSLEYIAWWGGVSLKNDSTHYVRMKLEGKNSDYTMGVATAARPAEGGVTSGDKDGNTGFDTTISATPNTGYVFDHWEWQTTDSVNSTNATTHTNYEQSFKVSCTGYQIYTAVFRKATYDVAAAPSPIDGGAVSGLGTYEYGTTANVTATPASGYTFSKWTWKDSNGDSHESTDQNLAIENIQASYNLTAVFKKTNHNVTVSATPVANDYPNIASVTVGSVENPTTAALTSVTSTVADGGTATLKATPYTAGSSGNMYHFKHWVANDGKIYTDNPMTIANITEDKSYIAVFEKQKYKVTVEPSPANGGTVDFYALNGTDPLQTGGTREYEPGTTVVLQANSKSAYKFYRFEGSDGTYYYPSGSNTKIEIGLVNADVTYKAIFIKEKVTITTNVTPAGKGTVKLQDASGAEVTDGKITGNTAATLTATPGTSGNYKFVRWQDSSGKTYTDNPLYLANVIKDETYTAVFGEPQYTITTVATPIEGGTVSGGREYAAGEEAKLYARAKTGYQFDHWSCSDGSSSYGEEVTDPDDPSKTANLLTITSVNGSATYTAHFVKENVTITINWTPTDYVNSDAYGYEIYYTKDGVDQGRLPTTKKFEMSSSGSATVRIVPKTGYKVKQWLDESNKSLGDGILTLVNVKTDSVYTAEMEKGQYKITAQSSPIDGGVAKVGLEGQTGTIGYINVDAGANVELTATPSTGYMFDHWSASDGTTASGTTDTNTGVNTLKISGVYGDETYTAHYIKNTVQIAAYTSPSNIGSQIEYYVPGLTPEDLTDKVKTNHGAKVTFTLTATPGTGYKFKQWTMSDNTTSTSNPLTVSNITKDMTYYAEFEVEGYTIKTVATPVDGGQVTGGSGNVKIAPGSSVTLRAIPETGFKFDYWSCDDGSVAAGTEDAANPGQFTLNIAHVYGDATYTAHFIKDAVSLTVDMNEPTVNKVIGSIGGSTQPHEFPTDGSQWNGIASGSTVTLTPVPGSGYKFKEWVKSGTTTPISTNPLIIANIKEAANYYAVFEIEAFKITTKSSPAEGGSISGNSGGASSGGSVTLTATAASGYVFTEWVDDTGATYKSNPLTYGPIYSDVTLTAKFKKSDDALTVLASPASGGHVTKNLNADGSVTIVATANKGYIYQEWRKGNVVLTTATSYVVSNITEKATYTAYFKVDPNYSAKSGITDEKFLNTRRLFKEPNYKNTRATMKTFASTFVASLAPQYELNGYVMKSAIAAAGERFATSSSELDMTDYEAALADHEIISTHNEIMRVYPLEDSGTYLEQAKELTTTKFGSQYSTELLLIREVTPPADTEWVDGTRTLLWQKTGAEYKDNIYIIWEQEGYQQKIIIPVTDLQGVLKFSVPQMGTPDTRTRMCVVRVKLQ